MGETYSSGLNLGQIRSLCRVYLQDSSGTTEGTFWFNADLNAAINEGQREWARRTGGIRTALSLVNDPTQFPAAAFYLVPPSVRRIFRVTAGGRPLTKRGLDYVERLNATQDWEQQYDDEPWDYLYGPWGQDYLRPYQCPNVTFGSVVPTIVNGGAAYTGATTITVDAAPAGGLTATYTPIITDGVITGLTPTNNGGNGYLNPSPSVQVTDTGGGSGAIITAAVTPLKAYVDMTAPQMVADGDMPVINPDHHEALAYFALGRAFLKDNDLKDPEKAQEFMGIFETRLTEARLITLRDIGGNDPGIAPEPY